MRWVYKLPLRLRSLFRKKYLEGELSDEMRFHLEKPIEENVAKGMSTEQARYAALREFGGIEQMKEECRDSWGVRFVSELGQDIRYGVRQLRRNPGFTAIASGAWSIARATGLDERYVRRILQCAFLAPDIVESILEGRQPAQLTFDRFRRPVPVEWSAQRRVLGFPRDNITEES